MTPHVALIVETSIHYGRRVLEGVTRYLRSHRPWSVFLEQRELFAAPPKWLRKWHGQGVICRKTTPDLAALLARAGIPLVDLNDISDAVPGVPRIESDQRAIGRLAADHLFERGFTRFAYCGFSDQAWAIARRDGFVGRLAERGQTATVYESAWTGPAARAWEREQAQIARWLRGLPRPVGLMACSDMRGQHVLDACQRLDVAVPEQIAVVGCDNDAVMCNLCHVPMSSVVPNPERVGYEAAALLDKLMAGQPAPTTPLLIEPVGVHTRQSTDVLAIDDPVVATALRYIRENAHRGCSMKDVLRHTAASRSLLERKFRQHLGHSPQAEIRHVQLKRVKQLLAESDLPLNEIAPLAGYSHPEYMSVVFKRETGRTPGAFRAAANPGFAGGKGG
ncbi:MAG: XylR family transcriptional regulator [Phycisphaerae bacterium]|nr:DNA-binding transcriptional regulator [Tepidisphaeraceae bacterium]